MSQYLQGVVDYIPMIQPFQPDFNLFTKVLETKEAQYKAGYDKLSSLYGTLLNSPMSRTDNIELRNKFFNDISSQIQKISALDLSKSQNVEAAYKVFQPLIEDDFILKDMSHTKTAYSEKQKGESLRSCTDPKKCPGQYWDGGIRLIDYEIENFKNARREDTLNMRNPRFVPKVNLSKQALDYAKEMNFKVVLPTHSPDGRYKIQVTNGPSMIPGLADTFMSVFGDDPAAMDYYNALSKLNRNDFIHDEQNISQYGSKDAAEMFYLDDTHRKIVEATNAQLEEAKRQEALASNKKETIDGIITSTGVDPNDPNDQKLIKARYQTMVDQMISSSNAETNEADLNAVASDDFETLDLDSKRSRIDGVAARTLLQGDLYQAASNYAMQTMQVESEVDQYALKEFDHALSVARMGLEQRYAKELDDYKTANQKDLYKSQKLMDMVASSYPNGKKNGALPDGSNPANLAWNPLGKLLPGGTALDLDLKGSDSRKIITATDQARSSAKDVMMQGYYQLKSIIDTPNGSPTNGGLIMTDGIRAYFRDTLKQIFGSSTIETVKGRPDPTGGSILDLVWNTITGDFTSETETKITSGGYLDENGNLMYTVDGQMGKNFADNPNFGKPDSEYSWEKVSARVKEFFKNDPLGKYSVDAEKNTETGQYSSGILASIDQYNTSKQNYDNYIKSQIDNNTIVHQAVMDSPAALKIYDELSNYPAARRDPNAGLLDIMFGYEAPGTIREHTKNSLNKMVTSGGSIMTLDQFRNVYANSPEARQTAEKVVQGTYKIQPNERGNIKSDMDYDYAVNTVIEYLNEDAEAVYEQYMNQFTLTYNQNEKAVVKNPDLKGFTPLSNFYMFNDAGAGVQAESMVATVDPAYPGDVQTQDYFDFYSKIVLPNVSESSDGIEVYAGLGTDLSERRFFSIDPDAVDDNQQAFKILQGLMTEINEGRDIEDKTRGIFDMYMHPIILNDQNKVAFSFSVSPQYADANKGTDNASKFMNTPLGNQFTVVIDKNKVPEVENLEMVKRLNQGPYTVAMRANKKVSLNSFPLGGNLNIVPTEGGSYVSYGTVNFMDLETLTIMPQEHIAFMGPGGDLESFAQRENQMLANINMQMANAQKQIKAMSPYLTRNPKDFDNQ